MEAAGVELFRALITRNLLILGTATRAKKAPLPDPLYVYCTKIFSHCDRFRGRHRPSIPHFAVIDKKNCRIPYTDPRHLKTLLLSKNWRFGFLPPCRFPATDLARFPRATVWVHVHLGAHPSLNILAAYSQYSSAARPSQTCHTASERSASPDPASRPCGPRSAATTEHSPT